MNILARDFLLLLDLLLILYTLHYIITAVRVQECIPVGCVPSATVAVCCWKGGACSGGVPAPGRGRGCLLPGVGVGMVSQHALRKTLPVDRQTGVKT